MRTTAPLASVPRTGGAGNCAWCRHPDGARWTQAVLQGASIRSVAAGTPFSASAGLRHMRSHVQNDLRVHAETVEGTTALDFVSRLVGIADDASRLREHARSTGNAALMLKAMASERDALTTLMARLGVDESEIHTALTDASVLRSAVVNMMVDRPELGEVVAAAYDRAGDFDTAEVLRGMASDRTRALNGTAHLQIVNNDNNPGPR